MGETLVATIVAFVVGYVVIGWLMRFISTNSFKPFVWYRIGLGVMLYILLGLGVVLLLFVAWELWWTNLDADRRQEAAATEVVREFAVPDTADSDPAGRAPSGIPGAAEKDLGPIALALGAQGGKSREVPLGGAADRAVAGGGAGDRGAGGPRAYRALRVPRDHLRLARRRPRAARDRGPGPRGAGPHRGRCRLADDEAP